MVIARHLGLVARSLCRRLAAAAHVVATPAYLRARARESITFEAPNERAEPMTEFAVTAPRGLVIALAPTGASERDGRLAQHRVGRAVDVEAVPPGRGWARDGRRRTATWIAATTAASAGAVTELSRVLEATGDASDVTLDTRPTSAAAAPGRSRSRSLPGPSVRSERSAVVASSRDRRLPSWSRRSATVTLAHRPRPLQER